jgi:Beta-lactamase
MTSASAANSEPIAAFVPELERPTMEAMDEWKIPGLAVAVVQNPEVALVRAYGLRDVEAGLKVTTDTQFLIGSITKSFTSTGLALLMDERRLDWTKPVRDYIPEFRLHDAVATDRITVRDLVSGTRPNPQTTIPAALCGCFRCEACGREAPSRRKDGSPYLEPHHVSLADGGQGTQDLAFRFSSKS